MAWSTDLDRKYLAPGIAGVLWPGVRDERSCGWSYTLGDVAVGATVGTAEVKLFSALRQKAKARPGIALPVYEFTNATDYQLQVWSDDPPYRIATSTKAPTSENKAKLLSVAKDLMERFTASRLSHPMAQVVSLHRGKDGERARRLLREWPYLKAAFDHIAPLATGYPRLAAGQEYTGDPGKVPGTGEQLLVLGVCPPPFGEQLFRIAQYLATPIEEETQSGAQAAELLVADAATLTVQCPRFGAWELDKPGDQVVLPSGQQLSHAYSLSASEDPVGLRGAVVLRDKEGQVVDVALYEVLRPLPLERVKGRYQEVASRKVLSECGGHADLDGRDVEFTCGVRWSDMLCHGRPESTGSKVHFEVTPDARIKVSQSEVSYVGESCIAAE